jgi:hypothetical protein
VNILIAANYYYPETVGAGIWVTQLVRDLMGRGHEVTVVTSFPSYPQGELFDGYRNRFSRRDMVDGVEVIRTFTHATSSKSLNRFGPGSPPSECSASSHTRYLRFAGPSTPQTSSHAALMVAELLLLGNRQQWTICLRAAG